MAKKKSKTQETPSQIQNKSIKAAKKARSRIGGIAKGATKKEIKAMRKAGDM